MSAETGFGCALALAGALFLAACVDGQPVDNSPPVTISPPGGAKVALLLPYGTDDNNNTELADSLEKGARLALSSMGNSPIELSVYPTSGTPEGAAEAAAHAIDGGASIILGPVFGDAAAAVGPIANQRGIPVLSFSNRPEVAGGNVFLLGHTHVNSATRILDFARTQGHGKVLITHAETDAGQASRRAVERAAEQVGIEIAGSVTYEFSQIGVINSVPEIVAALDETGADLLLLTGNTAGALPMLAQMIPEAGVDPEIVQMAGITRWDIPANNLRINGLQGGWFPLPDPNLSASFSYRYQYEFNVAPHSLAGLAYDGIVVADRLLRSAGGNDQMVINSPAGFSGADGVFRFHADGLPERGLAVAEVREFDKVVISQSPRSFADGET